MPRFFMHVARASALWGAGVAAAQQSLYSNSGGAVTNPGLATGTVASGGQPAAPSTMWSELQRDGTGAANATGGFACHAVGASGYRLADDFVVPQGAGWTLSGVSVYAYQGGAAQSPFTSATLRVWSGRPGDAGSVVVWGDTTTDRLAGAGPTNLYRVFNTVASPTPPAPDQSRAIWKVDLTVAVQLAPGTYWLDWQLVSGNAGTEAFSPAVTVAGLRAKPGANARQLRPSGVWGDVVDPGKPLSSADVVQDLPFVLRGSGAPAPCPSDVDGNGFVNGEDVDLFADWFAAGIVLADFDQNGFVNGDDYDFFIAAFEAGC